MKEEKYQDRLNFILPFNELDKYPALFEQLELQSIEFKVALSTLEEAFLNYSNVKKH